MSHLFINDMITRTSGYLEAQVMTFSISGSSKTSRFSLINSMFFCIALFTFSNLNAAEALGPPTLGEQTKGKPAIDETKAAAQAAEQETADAETQSTEAQSPFGTATVTEHKRENGQVYLIELEHSLGAKQYLYENDSDGQIGSSVEDNDSIKEIPKWKLGSW